MEPTRARYSQIPGRALWPGTPVLVRNSLNIWSPGFQVAAWRDDHCQVRRDSDGALLPRAFAPEDIQAI